MTQKCLFIVIVFFHLNSNLQGIPLALTQKDDYAEKGGSRALE